MSIRSQSQHLRCLGLISSVLMLGCDALSINSFLLGFRIRTGSLGRRTVAKNNIPAQKISVPTGIWLQAFRKILAKGDGFGRNKTLPGLELSTLVCLQLHGIMVLLLPLLEIPSLSVVLGAKTASSCIKPDYRPKP